MTNPLAADRLAALTMTGWLALAPTGRTEAFLLLTTRDPGGAYQMAATAMALGLSTGAPRHLPHVHVDVSEPGAIVLVIGGERFTRPGSGTWRAMAVKRDQVVLAVGIAPMPEGMAVDQYTRHYGPTCALAIIGVRA